MYKQTMFFRKALMVSTAFLIFASLFKMMHWPYAGIAMGIAWTSTLLFVLWALREVYQSARPTLEKFLWLIGFIIFPWIAGFVYYFLEVKPKYDY